MKDYLKRKELNIKWYFKQKKFEKQNSCLFIRPEQYIPKETNYCYSEYGNMISNCPFWDKQKMTDGYCYLLKCGDWMNNRFGLLFDQCKECGVNNNEEKNTRTNTQLKEN